jgi:hypothetical protein
MRIDDRRARIIGVACAGCLIAGPLAAIVLGWTETPRRRSPAWLLLALAAGIPFVALVASYAAMSRHQAQSGLPNRDRQAWTARAAGELGRGRTTQSLFHVFVPIVYLLSGSRQRRLTRYLRGR